MTVNDSPDAVTPIQMGVQLHRVYAIATEQLNSALHPMNLSARHIATMFMICDGAQTHRDLVHRLQTDKTGMVRVIDELEHLGFLSRTRSTRDRRVSLLALTNEGTAALQQAQKLTNGVADALFGSLDQHDIEALHRSLTRVLQESANEPPPA